MAHRGPPKKKNDAPPADGAASNDAPVRAPKAMTVDEVAAQIKKLETKLDRMIQHSRKKTDGQVSGRASPAGGAATNDRAAKPAEPLVPARGPERATELEVPRDGATGTEAHLAPTEDYVKQWGRTALRTLAEEVDDFGLDPKFAERVQPVFDFLYRRYFRVDTIGAHHVPSEGRCVVVANHSGTFPYDGVMLKTALLHAHPTKREVRWLAEDFIFDLPFLGAFMNRIGAVRACQENAERLLKQGRAVGVFPEGVKGIGKLFRQRYKLQRFGRGGFIRLCLRTETPIVPCAIVGAEESAPMLFRLEFIENLLGMRYLPVTPTFPALGPLGLVPAPTKWRIEFGDPIRFDGYGPEAADDSLLVGRLTEKVRSTIQAMLDRGVADRRSVWFG